MCEINFLCVHKQLRAKRLAPVLIKEVTRRVNKQDIWQAVYTAGVVIPRPIASVRYWHRSLNPKKLVEINFSRLGGRMTLARYVRLHRLDDDPKIAGLRPATPADVPAITPILNEYLSKFQLRMEFSEEDVHHWLLPREGVVSSYVVVDESSGDVTDFVSFYHLPSTIIKHEKHSELRAVYSFYTVPRTHSLHDLMYAALVLAKRGGADVFNALALMENETVFRDLKFGPGDGELNFYLYNWACPRLDDNQVGMVLL